ncbi:hypothetical protein CRYUN_Cryun17cG0138800 [Craigia yunnanensis]
MIKTSVFKDFRNGNDGLQVLEQEAFINGPVGLQGLKPTLNRLSKWLVAALFGGVILSRHDAEALWMAMGSIVNALLSVELKRVLNQERPVAGLKSDPGMPSSHAQSIFFTVVFTIASIMASSVTAASHDQSNSCGRCHRVDFLNFVVHVMECCCFGSI